MSLDAMIWALKKAPVKSGQEQVVLIALADHASSDGTGAYPSQATIAEYAQCSTRTVRTHTRAMEERGLIVRGDQKMVSHFSADRRPIVWDLSLHLEREPRAENISGRKLSVERAEAERHTGGSSASNGRKPASYKPSLTVHEPSSKPREDEQAHPLAKRSGRHTYSPEFERFWSVYPRKVGDKKKAEGFFGEQIAEGGVERIIQSAEEFRDECLRIGTAQRYIPYPATWLNQQRWKNVQHRPAQYANLAPIGSISASMTGDDEVFEMPTFKELE